MKTLQTYTQDIRIITRHWIGLLTPAEFMVVIFIAERTIGWSKPTERISLNAFINGVRSKGVELQSGINLSKSTLQRTLADLVTKGPINVKGTGSAARKYSLNLEWNMLRKPKNQREEKQGKLVKRKVKPDRNEEETAPTMVNLTTSKPALKRPKRAKLPMVNLTSPMVNLTIQSPILRIGNKRRKLREGDKSPKPPASSFDNAVEAIKFLSTRRAAKKSARLAELEKGKLSAIDGERWWTEIVKSAFPDAVVMPWGKKEKGQFSTLKKKWVAAGEKPAGLIEMLRWASENWLALGQIEFEWMNKPAFPAAPMLGVFVQFYDRILSRKLSGLTKKRKSVLNEGHADEVDLSDKAIRRRRKENADLTALIKKKQRKLDEIDSRTVQQVSPEDAITKRKARFHRSPAKERETTNSKSTIKTNYKWQDKN